MKENLEKYLKAQRFKLDVEEPESDLIWEGIRSGMQEKKNRLPEWFWKVAALFIFVISATYFVVNETSEQQIVVLSLGDVSAELGEQEAQLQHRVNLKLEQVQKLLPEGKNELQFLLNELNELDTIYASYQEDLNKTIDNEPVIRAMLDNYEKKIRILNRLLLEIEKEEYHETNTITL